MTTPNEPPDDDGQSGRRERGATPKTGSNKPPPLQLGLPKASTEAGGVEQPAALRVGHSQASRPARTLAGALGALVGLAALLAACAMWVLPLYVRHQCIEIAAEHGIDLRVDEAKIDPQGFRLLGVEARSADVPGARAQAPEVDVETSGLRPQKLTVHGAELMLAGRWRSLDSGFVKWRASPSGGQSGAWAPEMLVIEGARIVWQAPIGESVRVEAADVHAEVTWRERSTDLHARSDQVLVTLPSGQLGPWRVDVDRVASGMRMRVALDPGVPEACTVLVVTDAERVTSVDVVIPRSPLTHLGISEKLLGLTGQDLQIETTLHYTALVPTHADATMVGGIHGVTAPGLPRPIDVAWESTIGGDPTAGIDVKRARLAVGALVGPLTGTLKRFEDGFRVDLAWAAGPVPCSAFAEPLGLGQPFDIGYALRRLAGSAVATNIKGDISATAMLSFDSRTLGATRVDFTPDITCRGGWLP